MVWNSSKNCSTLMYLLVAIFLISPFTTFSQILWSKTYGVNNSSNWLSTVIKTNVGGFLLSGTREFSIEVSPDYWDYYSNIYLVRTDSAGNTIWEKIIGGTNDVDCASILQLSGGGYILAGNSDESHPGTRVADFFLMKIDSIGNKIWSKTFGGSEDDFCSSMIPTDDGGYILLGCTQSYGAGSTDIYVVKTDSLGNMLWSKTFGGTGADAGKVIRPTTNGGYIMVGVSSNDNKNYILKEIKIDSVGNILSNKSLGSVSPYINSITPCNGGYIFGGTTDSGFTDMYLTMVDTNGNKLWSNCYGGRNYEDLSTVISINGGGYLLGGGTSSFNSKSGDMYIVNVDSSGNIKWDQFTGTMDYEDCYVILPLNNGQFLLGGITGDAGNYKYYLIKLKPDTSSIHRDDSLAEGTFSQIYKSGPETKRINIVYVAEGYRQQDSLQFIQDIQKLVTCFDTTPPVSVYKNYFNHFGIYVSSKSYPPDSYFGAYVSGGDIRIKNTSEVDRLVQKYVPEHDLTVVVVYNIYGRSNGGSGRVVTLPSGNIFMHEFGHQFAGLGDEYESSGPYSIEHWNTTQTTDRASIEWKDWILPTTPIPTTTSFSEYQSVIGLFEGANYHPTGWYRPKFTCKMRDDKKPFCEVCSEAIIFWIYNNKHIRTIDTCTSTFSTIQVYSNQTPTIKITPMPSATIQTSWFIDEQTTPVCYGSNFNPSVPLSAGSHTISAIVRDTTRAVIKPRFLPYLADTCRWQVDVLSISTQGVIVVKPGWNMISLNIHPLDSSAQTVFDSIDGFVFAKNNTGLVYWPSYNINNLGSITTGSAYKVYTDSLDTLQVAGSPINVATTPVSLYKGWNMIAYFPQVDMPISTALSGVVSQISLAKDNLGQVYIPDLGINTIGDMLVGQGYKIYMKNAADLMYPSGSLPKLLAKTNNYRLRQPVHYICKHITGNNATVLVKHVKIGGILASDNSEIGAFDAQGNLVGNGIVIEGKAALCIWGDDPQTKVKDGCTDGEKIAFKFWNGTQECQVDCQGMESLKYQEDEIYTVSFTVMERLLINSFTLKVLSANPFKNQVRLAFDIPSANGNNAQDVKINIFNLNGRLVRQLANGNYMAGHHFVTWSASKDVTPGSNMYIIQMKAANFDKKLKLFRMK